MSTVTDSAMAFLFRATENEVTSPLLDTPCATSVAVVVVVKLSSLLSVVVCVIVVAPSPSSYKSSVEQAAQALIISIMLQK